MTRSLLAALALMMLSTPAYASDWALLERWLNAPYVKLVAVEFYSTHCPPCRASAPRWEALREKYKDQGLRLVVVNTEKVDADARCPRFPWRPDESVCDPELSERWGIEMLPEAFLWAWDGTLLVDRNAHIDEIEAAVRRYLASSPRVLIVAEGPDGKPDKALQRQLETGLADEGKFDVVPDKETQKLLEAQRKATHRAGARDDQRCAVGGEISPNSILKAVRYGGQLTLELLDLEAGCPRAIVNVDWNKSDPRRSVKMAVHALLAKARRRGGVEMPKGIRRAQSKWREERIGGSSGNWSPDEENDSALVHFESTPSGAQVRIDGKVKCQETPCRKMLTTGRHKIMMSLVDHQDRQETVSIHRDETLDWGLLPDYALVDIETTPPGLPIHIDGRAVGKSPLSEQRLDSGPHRVMVRSVCHLDEGEKLIAKAGETRTLRYTPKPRPAGVRVNVNDAHGNDLRADIFVDGKRLGPSPGPFTVGVCAKTLEARHKTKGSAHVALSLKERQTQRLTVKIGGASDLLWAVKRDFRQQLRVPSREITARYKSACKGGDTLACQYKTWHRPNGADRKAAVRPMSKACKAGNPVGCLVAGWALTQGPFGDTPKRDAPNPREGARLVQRGCELGLNRACVEMSRLYGTGVGVGQDPQRAVSIAEGACNGGSMRACVILGWCTESGLGVAKDEERATTLYEKACDGGNMLGCRNLGISYEIGRGVRKDVSRAAGFYRQSCEGGNMRGCTDLGVCYDTGTGAPENKPRAITLYTQACDGGEMRGCTNLGYNYKHGKGVSRNPRRAVQLYKQACDGGEAFGCYVLGVMSAKGDGVRRSDSDAAKLYKQACDGDSAGACFYLGLSYRDGKGVRKDRARAATLYEKACKANEMNACLYLAFSYKQGDGVRADASRAQELFTKACDGGVNSACENL